MGTTQSHTNISSILDELDASHIHCSTTRVVTKTIDTTKYQVQVQFGHTDDIVKNLRIPDNKFKDVVLTLGTQIFCGQLIDLHWCFFDVLPLFKLPSEPCSLTIYGLDGVTEVTLIYDAYREIPDKIKDIKAVVSGKLVYGDGYVC